MGSFYKLKGINKDIKKNKSSVYSFLKNITSGENLPFLILFLMMIILHRYIKMIYGDDLWFAEQSQKNSIIQYILWRYDFWTGRVSVEFVLYFIFKDSGALWRIINPLFIVLFAYSVSRIVIGKKYNNKKLQILINWVICFGWLYMNRAMLNGAMFWITGSINYLWTIAAGLFAMIPFRDALMKEYEGKFGILYIICAIFAGLGQEQVALVMVTFAIIINIYIFVTEKRIYKFLILETLLIIISVGILFLAPGNYERVYAETNTWLPNYPLYSIWELGFNGLQWFLDSVVNHSKWIFLSVLSSVGISIYKKNYRFKINKITTIIPFVGIVLIIVSMLLLIYVDMPKEIVRRIPIPSLYATLSHEFNDLFLNFMRSNYLIKADLIKFIGWSVLIFIIPFYIINLFKFSVKGTFTILIYLAGICSSLVIFVSPTIYASGLRTVFVLNVLFFMTFILIMKDINSFWKKKYIILYLIIPIVKYISIFAVFVKNF